MEKQTCIIIGAGDFSESTIPEYKKGRTTLIAVDGGLAYCRQLALEPDIIIGDFDSSDAQTKSVIKQTALYFPEKVIRLKPEKDDTDMLAALKWGLAAGMQDFIIYGGLGGRLDHTLANIQCLLYLKNRGADGCLRAGVTTVTVITAGVQQMSGISETDNICSNDTAYVTDIPGEKLSDTVVFSPDTTGILSLFSMEKESVVSIENMKYPLSHYTVTNDFPIGTSNEFIPGRSGRITVYSGSVAVIVTREDSICSAFGDR